MNVWKIRKTGCLNVFQAQNNSHKPTFSKKSLKMKNLPSNSNSISSNSPKIFKFPIVPTKCLYFPHLGYELPKSESTGYYEFKRSVLPFPAACTGPKGIMVTSSSFWGLVVNWTPTILTGVVPLRLLLLFIRSREKWISLKMKFEK